MLLTSPSSPLTLILTFTPSPSPASHTTSIVLPLHHLLHPSFPPWLLTTPRHVFHRLNIYLLPFLPYYASSSLISPSFFLPSFIPFSLLTLFFLVLFPCLASSFPLLTHLFIQSFIHSFTPLFISPPSFPLTCLSVHTVTSTPHLTAAKNSPIVPRISHHNTCTSPLTAVSPLDVNSFPHSRSGFLHLFPRLDPVLVPHQSSGDQVSLQVRLGDGKAVEDWVRHGEAGREGEVRREV